MSASQSIPDRFQPTHLLVHYNEIALKGRNRDWFESLLVRNLRLALGRGEATRIDRLYGRLRVTLGRQTDWRAAATRSAGVFGVAHVVPTVMVEATIESLLAAARDAVLDAGPPRSFRVSCKRANKEFPHTSMEVQRLVGGAIHEATGWRVDLEHAELCVAVEIVNRDAFLGCGRVEGAGGLPTGAAGRVVCLLSGGIDSPVAAHSLLRRGATAIYVHFHSFPHTGIESQEKVRDLASLIQPPGHAARLYMVPFAELQRRIVAGTPAPLRVVLYRRFMVRVAEAIARREQALALVTGESLGQVASQTLENLRAIDAAASLPILRPLIGHDKRHIVEAAQRIGTFAVSIEPHSDCCSFLLPPHPATRSTPEELEAAECVFDIPVEVDKLVAAAAVVEVRAREPASLQPVPANASTADKEDSDGEGVRASGPGV